MCMDFLHQTKTGCCCHYQSNLSPKRKGAGILHSMNNYTQWSWSGRWRWSSTCSWIKAARPSSSGWRGLEQALGGGWRSSENSVYVAFLKSRRSFTGLGEHHWWKYMHCDQMLERLPKHCIFLPIIKARMPLCNWGMIKRDMWSELVGGWETVRQRCLTRDCNLPQVAAHTFTQLSFSRLILEGPTLRWASISGRAHPPSLTTSLFPRHNFGAFFWLAKFSSVDFLCVKLCERDSERCCPGLGWV